MADTLADPALAAVMGVAYNAGAPVHHASPPHPRRAKPSVTGAALLAVIAFVIGIFVAYRAGAASASRNAHRLATEPPRLQAEPAKPPAATVPTTRESAQPTGANPAPAPELAQLRAFAEDRYKLFGDLADARAEIARYRQIVVDIEHNAPPPLLDAPGTPDDLKLIVGVGPVIERMLYQLGIATYRQIARWSERDIDDFDARLREFPGRIRRDGWVTQARALHIGKYGSAP